MMDIVNKQLALLLCLVLRPIRIFTMLVALPVSTPKCFSDYVRIHIRIDIRLRELFSTMYSSRHPQYIQYEHIYSKSVNNQFCYLFSVQCLSSGGVVTEKLLPWPGLEIGKSHNHWLFGFCALALDHQHFPILITTVNNQPCVNLNNIQNGHIVHTYQVTLVHQS